MEQNNPFSIKNWAEDDKPREKLMLKGKSALSDAELLAILIGSGNRNESAVDLSKRILSHVDNNLNALGKLSLKQLIEFKGIGEAKAIAIIAATEIGRRRREENVKEAIKINSSQIVFNVMQPLIGELPHEEFWVLYLNNANKIVHKAQLSKGGFTGTVVDIRIVLKFALEYNALSIVLTHNHPSGKLIASESDIQLTQKIKAAVKQLDIALIDHVIITENNYYSFADNGIL
ncbi:MAG: DNA repair protein RadC [Flavobacterium sp.]|uniref:RadC family protein n=1 Tax=Flavobacterium sp. TaxID=239 RepID=UPI001DEF60ED|nr:DNA repair protein RadC [Flavobacterium sp.]